MKIRMNCFFKIFDACFWKQSVILGVFLLVGVAFARFQWVSLLAAFCIFVSDIVLHLFSRPRSFVLRYGVLRYQETIGLSGKHGHGRTLIKVEYVVTNASIECQQNRLEKMFDVGHIVVRGNTEVEAKKEIPQYAIPTLHRIYGIPHFTSFCENIEEYCK